MLRSKLIDPQFINSLNSILNMKMNKKERKKALKLYYKIEKILEESNKYRETCIASHKGKEEKGKYEFPSMDKEISCNKELDDFFNEEVKLLKEKIKVTIIEDITPMMEINLNKLFLF